MDENQALQEASKTDADAIDSLLQEAEVPQTDLSQADPNAPPANEPEPPVVPKTEDEPPAAPEVEKQTAEVKDEDDTEEELAKYVLPENASKNAKETVKALKEAIKNRSQRTRELQQELRKAEEQNKSTKVLTPEIEAQLSQLQKERDELDRTLKIKDSEGYVRNQYSPIISQIKTEAITLLKNWGTSEEVAKFISDNGGVDDVMFSNELMPDGRTTREAWFKSQILDAMNPRQRFEFDARIRQLSDKSSEQSRAMQSAQQDSERFYTEQQQKIEEGRKQWMERLLKAKEEHMKILGPGSVKLVIEPKDTPEDKAIKEEHNKWLDESEKTFQGAIQAQTPEQVAQIGVMAATANYLGRMVEKQHAQIEALKKDVKTKDDKLAAITKARSTARPSNAPPASSSTPKPSLKPMSDADAIEAELRRSESK